MTRGSTGKLWSRLRAGLLPRAPRSAGSDPEGGDAGDARRAVFGEAVPAAANEKFGRRELGG